MTDQSRPPADPIRVLQDTRRTLLQLVATIEATIADARERTAAGKR